ncbi:hypothetical protein POM88_024335 [Heracleum sosnowskyi]|uniref:Uncharacterized protein n=1 Tax=Heracleum sosnowskyi TaxID=360622 RepID=A0AAD8I2X3_9APIA|nr:hypothetical protein POM88_024335 [Heracleum sosnowskyi]
MKCLIFLDLQTIAKLAIVRNVAGIEHNGSHYVASMMPTEAALKSLESGLDQKRMVSCGSDSENETVQEFSSERSHDGISSATLGCDKDLEATCCASLHISSGMANDEIVF